MMFPNGDEAARFELGFPELLVKTRDRLMSDLGPVDEELVYQHAWGTTELAIAPALRQNLVPGADNSAELPTMSRKTYQRIKEIVDICILEHHGYDMSEDMEKIRQRNELN